MMDAQPDSAILAADLEDPLLGRALDDRYRILEQLGAGGMGRVYLAVEAGTERYVALKILPLALVDPRDPSFVDRFSLEASMASRLDHPHAVQIYETGRSREGIFYIAMEYLEGRTLAGLLEKGPLPADRVIRIISQVARAIQQAHDRGLVHRDLKPSNIMLVEREGHPDFVKVLDFGLARFWEGPAGCKDSTDRANGDLSHTTSFHGSPHYMAPEQARSERPTPAVDVYSLGAIAYEMVCGRLPYSGESPIAILLEQQKHDPKRPRLIDASIPHCLERVIVRAMERDPLRRYGSMDEFLEALAEAAGTLGVPDLPQTLTLLTAADLARIEHRPWFRRNTWRAIMAAGAMGALGAAVWRAAC